MRVRASRSGDAGTRGSVREGETLTARERARRRTRANVFENVSARRALTQRARRRPLATAARGRRPRVTPDDADGFADDARRCGGERFARSRGVRARVERARGWREAFGGKRTRGANGRGDGAEPARGEGRLARHLRGLRAERPPRQPRRVQPRRRRRRERRARRRRRSDPPRARTHRGLRPRGFAPLLSPPRGAANSATATSRSRASNPPPAVRRLRGRPFPRRFSARRPPRRQPRRFRLVRRRSLRSNASTLPRRAPPRRASSSPRVRETPRRGPNPRRSAGRSSPDENPGPSRRRRLLRRRRRRGRGMGRRRPPPRSSRRSRSRIPRRLRDAATSRWFPARRFSANPIPRRPARATAPVPSTPSTTGGIGPSRARRCWCTRGVFAIAPRR